MSANDLHVQILSLGGVFGCLSVHRKGRIHNLKVIVEASYGIPVMEQRYVVDCTVLEDSTRLRHLSSCSVEPLTVVVNLVRRSSEEMAWIRDVCRTPSRLAKAPGWCRSDYEIVRAALHVDAAALQHAGEDLKANRRLVLQAIHIDGLVLQHAAKELRDDPEVVSIAVRSRASALQFASPRLSTDRGIVLEALHSASSSLFEGNVLQYASPALARDRVLVDMENKLLLSRWAVGNKTASCVCLLAFLCHVALDSHFASISSRSMDVCIISFTILCISCCGWLVASLL
mmetsp:Transcript_126086/g.223282  ORF Transcript_126086/g.223282 Transcript_126086/m.223282 type:complete len:287 (-) Transcript_126086:49-909(-)